MQFEKCSEGGHDLREESNSSSDEEDIDSDFKTKGDKNKSSKFFANCNRELLQCSRCKQFFELAGSEEDNESDADQEQEESEEEKEQPNRKMLKV